MKTFIQPTTISRIIEIAEEKTPKPLQKLEVLRKRLVAVNTVVPQNFEDMERAELIKLGFDYDLRKFDPESFESVEKMREFIRDGLKDIDKRIKSRA